MNDRLLIKTIRRVTGTTGPADRLAPEEYHRTLHAVRQLSRSLNHDRSIVEDAYLGQDDALLGYVAFFLPRSVAQFRALFPLLGRTPRRVVDLGSGPGPASLVSIETGANAVLAVDHARAALDVVEHLTEGRVETRSVDLQTVDVSELVATFEADTVVSGHVMNELWKGADDAIERRANLLGSALRALPRGGRLLVVDPALRETSRQLLAVRDHLARAGFTILSPCLRQGPCPALDDERDWCHAERPWHPGPLVSRIAEDIGVRADVFKMSYFVVGRPDEAARHFSERTFRIVSEPLHTKGRLRYFGCGSEGRFPLVMKERDATGEAADFATLQRYDVVQIGKTIQKGDGEMIAKGEPAKRLATADEPIADQLEEDA